MTLWATDAEAREHFHATTCERRPADPGDIRFEQGEFRDGMEETPFWLEMIDDTGTVIETHFFGSSYERGSMVVGFRESQARRSEADRLGKHPLELEFEPFGPAWQREQAGAR